MISILQMSVGKVLSGGEVNLRQKPSSSQMTLRYYGLPSHCENQVYITQMKNIQKSNGEFIFFTLMAVAAFVMARASLKLPFDEPTFAILLLALILFLTSFVLAAGVVFSMRSRIKERDGEGPTVKNVRLAVTSAYVASFLGNVIVIAALVVGIVRIWMAIS